VLVVVMTAQRGELQAAEQSVSAEKASSARAREETRRAARLIQEAIRARDQAAALAQQNESRE
jgi:hypothetical protein